MEKKYLLSTIAGIIFVVMLILYLFEYSESRYKILEYFGIVLWGLAAIFGVVPIFEFKRKGGVRKGTAISRQRN